MTRMVKGLKWATVLGGRPGCIPAGRSRGAKAHGVRYERALAKAMPWAAHGTWWEFEDRNGHGYCQTDFLLEWGGGFVVVEAKYSWTAEGHEALRGLYLPVVKMALRRDARGVVACKRLVKGMPNGLVVCGTLGEALVHSEMGEATVWHWIGTGAIAWPFFGAYPPMGIGQGASLR